MSRKVLKALALRVSILVTSLLVTLLILEVVVRIFIPQQLTVRQPHMYKADSDGFGWKHQANVNTVVNTGEGRVHFFTDENGFRVGSANQPPRTPDYKVLVLGDSYLEALQVEYEDTLTAYIERELTAQLNIDVEVVDTGVSDWDPNHYLMQTREALANDDYDLVLVFLYSPNDIIGKYVESYPPRKPSKQALHWPKNFSRKELVDNLFIPINDSLEELSHLYVFTKNRSEVILVKVGASRYYLPSSIKRSYADSDDWTVTADICAMIADEAERYDASTIFIHLPGLYSVETERLDWYFDALNVDPATIDVEQPSRILERELQARGLTFLDAGVPLSSAYEADEGRLYGKIDPHFTPLGHQIVGEFVTDWLLNNTFAADTWSFEPKEGG